MACLSLYKRGEGISFLEELEKNSTVKNTKDGQYYLSTYDANLDVFAGMSRYTDSEAVIDTFKRALS